MAKGAIVNTNKSEVLQGTLDLMILKTLQALGPLHGFGIARRIEQVSEDVLTLNEGTVYTSLLRLQQQGCIDSKWGTSENNRKARFYSITSRGRKAACSRDGQLGANFRRDRSRFAFGRG
jgi:PadR family transcriptional regulator PadR